MSLSYEEAGAQLTGPGHRLRGAGARLAVRTTRSRQSRRSKLSSAIGISEISRNLFEDNVFTVLTPFSNAKTVQSELAIPRPSRSKATTKAFP